MTRLGLFVSVLLLVLGLILMHFFPVPHTVFMFCLGLILVFTETMALTMLVLDKAFATWHETV